MHARDQHFLVVRTVVDADASALGQRLHGPPQVVVIALLGGRRLEAEDLAALRVDARHDVPDRAVLARGVHRLEDHQQRVGVLRVELVLLLGELLDAVLEQRERFLLVLDRSGPTRVVVLERDLLAGRGDELVHQLSDFLHRYLASCPTRLGPDRSAEALAKAEGGQLQCCAPSTSGRRRHAGMRRLRAGSSRRASTRRPAAWRTRS